MIDQKLKFYSRILHKYIHKTLRYVSALRQLERVHGITHGGAT
jgi:hypothetical protein